MLKHFLVTMSVVAISFMAADAALPTKTPGNPNQQPVGQTAPAAGSSLNILHPRMRDAFLKQISVEQYSSNLYLTYASYFGDLGLDGCEQFFREASAEETEHALLFYNLLIDRGEKFQMGTVNASANMPTSVLDAFQKHLENEIQVTKAIHNLYSIALEENDYASQAFLHPFLLLQVQEEKEAMDLVQLLELGPNDPAFILMLDTKLKEATEKD